MDIIHQHSTTSSLLLLLSNIVVRIQWTSQKKREAREREIGKENDDERKLLGQTLGEIKNKLMNNDRSKEAAKETRPKKTCN